MKKTFDRASQDVGNILAMEHVNVTAPDQVTATQFYVSGLGFTRDPYMMVSPENMWVNVGQQQFHLPTREPQVLRGVIGLVVPDLEALKMRLTGLREQLAGTQFTCAEENGHVNVTGPWGNQFRCHAPDAEAFGEMTLGIPYVEFPVKRGAAAGIGQFYKQVMQAPYTLCEDTNGAVVDVSVGCGQKLVFRETRKTLPDYDGHHIAVYVANFSGPHAYLDERGPDHGRERPLPVPVPGHRQSGNRQGAVYPRTRSAEHAPPYVGPGVHQPQRGARHPLVRPRPGRLLHGQRHLLAY